MGDRVPKLWGVVADSTAADSKMISCKTILNFKKFNAVKTEAFMSNSRQHLWSQVLAISTSLNAHSKSIHKSDNCENSRPNFKVFQTSTFENFPASRFEREQSLAGCIEFFKFLRILPACQQELRLGDYRVCVGLPMESMRVKSQSLP